MQWVKSILSILLVLNFIGSHAQNSVVNGGFESYTLCPDINSSTCYATNWTGANLTWCGGRYLNSCATNANWLVPVNAYGNQVPRNGNAYGVLELPQCSACSKSYLVNTLSGPLLPGKTYTFSMYVSLSDISTYAHDQLGVYFSVANPRIASTFNMNVSPQIVNTTFLTDKTGWTLVTGNYTATGGESFITIGSFVPGYPSANFQMVTSGPNTTYYYVDDVSLVPGCVIPPQVLGPDKTICADSNTITTLNATNGPTLTYLWNNGATTPSININKSGTYWVRMNAGSCIEFDTIVILYKPIVRINLGNDTTLCTGSSIRLGAITPPSSVIWSTAVSGNFITVNSPGIYWVQTNLAGCIFRDSITIKVADKPPVNIGADRVICAGDSLVLRSSFPDSTFRWSNGSTDSVIVAKQANFYWLQVSNKGCFNRDSMYLNTVPKPLVNLGLDSAYCGNQFVRLRSQPLNPTYNYSWSTGSIDTAIDATVSGLYSLRQSRDLCSHSDTIQLLAKPIPIVSLGNDTAICDLTPFSLNAQNTGSQYLWKDNSALQTLSITNSGLYWVKVTKDGCYGLDTIQVTVSPKPNLELGSDTSFCENGSITFDVSQLGATYKWQNGSALFKYTSTQSEKVIVELRRGACVLRDSVNVGIVPKPILYLGADRSACFQPSSTLACPIKADRYLWNTGSTDSAIVIQNTGLYWLQINQSVCSVTDTILIAQAPIPLVDIGSTPAICKEDSILLDAQNIGSIFEWNTSSINQSIYAKAPNTYWVKVTNTQGCLGYDTIALDTFVSPVVNLGNDTFVCAGSVIKLTTDIPFNAYNWNDGTTNSTLPVTNSGTYFVRVLDQNNCIAYDTLLVSTRALPKNTLPSLYKVCEPNLTLNAPPNLPYYLWSTGETTESIVVKEYGTYSVEIMDVFNCSNKATTEVKTSCPGTVFVPNAFTPNGDGINDGFIPSYRNVLNATLYIYDRWGQLLFETNNTKQAWDGLFKAQPAPSDVYVYRIIYTGANEETQSMGGNVTLMR